MCLYNFIILPYIYLIYIYIYVSWFDTGVSELVRNIVTWYKWVRHKGWLIYGYCMFNLWLNNHVIYDEVYGNPQKLNRP